jgi:HK97 family phage major capsid protein
MNERLTKLLEARAAAQNAYDEFINPLIEAGNKLTEEQETRRAELRGHVEAYDARIDEVEAEEKRSAHLAEVRSGIGGANAGGSGIEVSEPTTYGKGSEHSYFADMAYASLPTHPLFRSAHERLNRASHEAAVEMVRNPSTEKRERIRDMIREEQRAAGKDEVREALKRHEALGATGRGELRAMDTGAASGGSFATPVYFLQEYAPFREAGRAFADQCNKQELPAYGMTVYLPHVTAGAEVADQASQNTAVAESDPTAGYLSANLATKAGQVTISQQLLDRSGPGFSFDKLVLDQLERDYAPKVDLAVLTAALANAGAITYTDTEFAVTPAAGGIGKFLGATGHAKATVRTAPGTYLNPKYLFIDPSRWEVIAAWTDTNGRPVVVPNYAGPMNALAAGSATGDVGVEGDTGYRFNGLRAFTDHNIPAPTTGADQAIVGDLDEVYVFEGIPVTRALPQTKGDALSVIIQLYSYMATIVRYPNAVQAISGTGMSTIAWT